MKPERLRILIVENEAIAAESLRDLLELWGYLVCVSSNGQEALGVAWELKPNVILLDIGPPLVDGYDFARIIRNDPVLGRVLILAVTGHTEMQDQVRAYEAGINFVLTKSLNLDLLRRLLEFRAGRVEHDEQS